nr:TIGR03084 family metal-binding protein [Brevibacterium ravenspurgense]
MNVLDRERQALLDLIQSCDDSQWAAPTPAEGWDVRDQIIHLAHFDYMAGLAFAVPEQFAAALKKIASLEHYVDLIGPANISRSNEDVLRWWHRTADFLTQSARSAADGDRDSAERVPWFGGSMSPASMITARVMETWAHGQDVFDTFGKPHAPSAALDNIAHLGVRAFANSFAANGKEVPDVPVRVTLTGYRGTTLEFGPEDAANTVAGTAEDFAHIVTQRRHVDDTGIEATGPVAREWMLIAQAFAGKPGSGRRPGQFSDERSNANGARQ